MPEKEMDKYKSYILLGAIVIIIPAGASSQFCALARLLEDKEG